MIAKEGYPVLAVAATLWVVCLAACTMLSAWSFGLAAAGTVLFAMSIWHWRDPARFPPHDSVDVLLAPADGRVSEIVDENEPFYLRGPSKRLSISSSAMNVRICRSPLTGVLEYAQCEPMGNRATVPPRIVGGRGIEVLGVRHPTGNQILYRRTSASQKLLKGAVPRTGIAFSAGERGGALAVRSRHTISVPAHVALNVCVGQRVVAGETILASLVGPREASTVSEIPSS